MLQIMIPISPEGWDEKRQEFVAPKYKQLQLEHSLLSLSKWERKWHKAFFSNKEKTDEEMLDYVRCMTVTPNVEPEIYNYLTTSNVETIRNYIDDPMTAIVFPKDSVGPVNRETVMHEIIYYWMVSLNIPIELEKWHLNCLINLIRVCNIKNAPPKKRSMREIMSRNAALNAARKKQLNTKG